MPKSTCERSGTPHANAPVFMLSSLIYSSSTLAPVPLRPKFKVIPCFKARSLFFGFPPGLLPLMADLVRLLVKKPTVSLVTHRPNVLPTFQLCAHEIIPASSQRHVTSWFPPVITDNAVLKETQPSFCFRFLIPVSSFEFKTTTKSIPRLISESTSIMLHVLVHELIFGPRLICWSFQHPPESSPSSLYWFSSVEVWCLL